MSLPPPAALGARLFDGHSARALKVELRREGNQLLAQAGGRQWRWPLDQVRWPERSREGRRVAELPDGMSLHALDNTAWDGWCEVHVGGPGWIDRLQGSWRATLLALAGLVLLAVLTQQWGVPWAARALVEPMPRSVDQSLEAAVIDSLGPPTLSPTRLPPARQAEITAAWEAAKERLDRSLARQGEPASPALTLRFHASRLGPNAMALPGGTVVITDELVALAGEDMPLLLGVLGHEQGHVQHRHGLRMAAQVGLLSVLVGSLWGDPSSLVSALPLWWGQADYSREAEREADAWSLRLLQANGLDPRAMVRLFQALAAGRTCAPPPADCAPPAATGADVLQTLGFASHPAPAERLRFFEQAAGRS